MVLGLLCTIRRSRCVAGLACPASLLLLVLLVIVPFLLALAHPKRNVARALRRTQTSCAFRMSCTGQRAQRGRARPVLARQR